jgi:hypothetical protein
LGAVLLIPKTALIRELNAGNKPFKPVMYGTRFNSLDYQRIRGLAERFCVSVSAMKIRLREIDQIIDKAAYEYKEPLLMVAEAGGTYEI